MNDAEIQERLRSVIGDFVIYGDLTGLERYGSGHINDTYLSTFEQAGRPVRYIHQRINDNVFKDPVSLMENVRRVTEHQAAVCASMFHGEFSRRHLTLIPTKSGGWWVRDADGKVWRTYLFIEGASTHDVVRTEAQAESAARAFGSFASQLAELPGGPLSETIPRFHDSEFRFSQLRDAVAKDASGRVAECGYEIEFFEDRAGEMGIVNAKIADGTLPIRVTHNDTKLNNVLIDDVNGEGVCVIDLDTVMPGTALYDFGDLVRTSTSQAAEDERDLSLVSMRAFMFDALARGFLEGATFLTDTEREMLPIGAKLIVMNIGMRFLTDHLSGDTYFKIHRPGHNLDRCRTQVRLTKSIEDHMEQMKEIIRSYS